MITVLENSPINSLFLAINYYVSTGEFIGTGHAVKVGPQRHPTGEPHPDDLIKIILIVNPVDPVDLLDFKKFCARFDELTTAFATGIVSEESKDLFLVFSFTIRYGRCGEMATALTGQPGPLGWGSMKPLIDTNFKS